MTPVPHFAYTNLLDNSLSCSALRAQRRRNGSATCKLRNRQCRLRHVDRLTVVVVASPCFIELAISLPYASSIRAGEQPSNSPRSNPVLSSLFRLFAHPSSTRGLRREPCKIACIRCLPRPQPREHPLRDSACLPPLHADKAEVQNCRSDDRRGGVAMS